MVVVPTYTLGCVYNLNGHSAAEAAAKANGNSVGGWIFSGADAAVQNGYPTCRQTMANFDHIFMIVGALPSASWAGLGFQPGSRFIIQVRPVCRSRAQCVPA